MTISAVAPTAEYQELSGTDRQARFADEAIPYIRRLYPTALRLTRNHCDAEDLLQETFAKAYVKFHQYSPGTNLRAWLHRILVTTFYSSCRRRERRATEVLAAEIFDSAGQQDGLAQLPRSAEAEALENIGDSRVMHALGTLPECFKVAVYLADVEGYRYAEVAELTGAPLGTVMSRIHRGRAMLRQNLRPRTPGDRVTGDRAGARRTAIRRASAKPSAADQAATPPDVLRMAA